jgi:small subunit ribosomal protein S11
LCVKNSNMLKKKSKLKKNIRVGVISIKTTYNNTIVTVCDLLGNVLCWSSAGTSGFKSTRKSTPFAAQMATKSASLKAMDLGLKKVEIIISGRGNGREAAIRVIKNSGLSILSIEDKTSIPYNGCRPPKRRRL